MPASAAVPLACVLPTTDANIGTGFVGSARGRRAIYTAAHIPTKMNMPPVLWSIWPKTMTFWGPHQHFDAPLFHTDPGVLTPGFTYVQPANSPTLTDMMALPEPRYAALLTDLDPYYTTVDVEGGETPPSVDDVLTCYGFPAGLQRPRWPYQPPTVTSGPIVRVELFVIFADMPSEVGFSGGPVFDPADRFIGMLIGSDSEGLAMIVRASSLLLL